MNLELYFLLLFGKFKIENITRGNKNVKMER